MPEMTSYQPGAPSWVDLTTSDPQGARAFYGGLFGWEFDDIHDEQQNVGYTNCLLRGKKVAGMGSEPAPEGWPTAWTTYFDTDDADASAERITGNGGTLLMEPTDVDPHGRMVIATDPTGATFGLWQAGGHLGAELAQEPGTVCWSELTTTDLAGAQDFYTKVLDVTWERAELGADGPQYFTFHVGGQAVGGALALPEGAPTGIPPHWTVYFAVDDADATAERIRELGGTVVDGPADSPYGRWTLCNDPQGAMFMTLQLPEGMGG